LSLGQTARKRGLRKMTEYYKCSNNRERIVKARYELIRENPFFGYLVLNLKIINDDKDKHLPMDTMGVNIRGDLRYRDKFVDTLNDEELKTVLAHETLHLGLEHLKRCGNRDSRLFNIAADLAVNWYLKKNGFAIPQGCLISSNYENMFAEEIYAELEKNATKIPVNCFNKFNPEGDMEYDKNSDDNGDGKSAGKKKENSSGKEGEKDGENEGEGNGDIDWKEKMVEAAQKAKMMGKEPNGLERYFEKELFPENNWRAILYKFINKSIARNSNFNRPNRRFISRGIYLPSKIKENMDIVMAIDTSGSIDKKLLDEFYRELITVRDSFSNIKVTIITCDADIQEVIDIKNHETPDIKMSGGGGTNFSPVYSYIEENKPNTKILIYLTDLYGEFPENEGSFRTLWAVPKSSEGVEIPFGDKLVIDNGESE
jgi:predicted metal-dependent peptidase